MDQLLENRAFIVIITVVGVLVVFLLLVWISAGGDSRRMGIALRSFGRALWDREFADKVEPWLAPSEPKDLTPPRPSGAPLRLLALLQREGRLLDFLLEDLRDLPDVQIGAAVRDIHRQAQAALKEHLVLTPVLPQAEGSTIDVAAGFDPSAIRLVGNVTGQPPFRGTLQHHGWRVRELKLGPPPEGQDEFILQPAEVELP